MDLVLAKSSDNVLNSLHLGLPESVGYLTDCKQVHFPSVSGNIFSSSNANKFLEFVITGEHKNYIDLSRVVCSLMLLTLPRLQVSLCAL